MIYKTFLMFVFTGLLCAGTIQAQWLTEKCPTNNKLNSIAFSANSEGWIVGDKGIILHRTKNQWTQWQRPITENLYSVCMVDEQNGWAVGESGTILHFDGNTWMRFNSPTSNNLFSVSFIDADHGVAVGDYGTVLTFKDGVWSPIVSTSRAQLFSVNVQTDNAWIGGGLECVNVPLMKINMHSRDKSLVNELDSYASINGISFSNPDNGWAVGIASSLLHFDGQRWEKVSVGENHSSLKSVFFSDDNNGISVGYGGTILTYRNGFWNKETSLSTRDLNSGTINGDAYYAIGDSGTILTMKILPEKLLVAPLEEKLKVDFMLFPNPCKDVLNIILPDSYSNKSVLISISDILGQVEQQKEFNVNQTKSNIQFNTSQLKNGTYLLHVVEGSAISETRFAIMH